jgi:hypothetical protein
MASLGTQRNGLPVEVDYFDTIGVHDYADTTNWPTYNDSTWVLDPTDEDSPYYGKAVKITELQLDLAEDIVMHDGGELVVDFHMTGVPVPVKSFVHSSMADWITKSSYKEKIDNQGVVGPFIQYNIIFSIPPIFWTSAGLDAQGNPKLNQMHIYIADHVPYKDTTGNPAKIARPRYYAEVYTDPDI